MTLLVMGDVDAEEGRGGVVLNGLELFKGEVGLKTGFEGAFGRVRASV